ncbi:uncharacterized protein Bfra_003012 [Botrytis fragariae]|uniref:Uncharacterized protein n=1 Tax=Botrytis fragariae TaxID=1964551 RepID=A0A8H6AZP6_9HELO|nr:uncharacterized protein Bfra_003012 [Botrytis fragariae]KAF5876606.1 hypothetical protein Bfra_003012 [Botrytis fragariae]
MGDPLLRMAGLPGMRSLGNGPLPDDGDDRIPTERYLYNTRELYDIKTKKPDADFVSNDYYGVPTLEDKIRISMRHAMGEFCWIRGFVEVLRRRENDGSQEAKEVLIDFLGFISTRVVWSVKCCNQEWKSDRNTPIIEKSLTWLKRNKLFHPCIKHISIDFDPRDEFNVPFFEDFVTLCWYISTHLPDLDSAILCLTIAGDDFQEVLKSPMRFSWVQAFRELRIGKVNICPKLTKSGESDESRRYRSRHSIDERFAYFLDFHHARLGIKSLLLNDLNNERGLITHMLTPGSKLWGYTDDIDDDAYISLQYMES